MRRDLDTAEREAPRHLQNRRYHDGGWSAIPLVSIDGGVGPEALAQTHGFYGRTPILARCPYLEAIIDGFRCPKQRVRLMRLEPGANILEHSDGPAWSWAFGKVARLHIPIVTHEQVEFLMEGARVDMRPGELWYCDVSRPHRVANRAPIARVHLVVDLTITPWLRTIFPSEPLRERAWNWAYRGYHQSGLAHSWPDRLRRRLWDRAFGPGQRPRSVSGSGTVRP
ncbi:MAG: aspartyl/asparaginyl beta-hydroxylase domain-containing protein [Candidatus Rokubacteria bacterium]|nr:aspartyl/asparaginyl beta-hydroxylase domain-containing protein [Candidatus Rokubacteria bacterium]